MSFADCAENFDMFAGEPVDPGTVTVINADGSLSPCVGAYDKKAAGVISGAGAFRPAIVLDSRASEEHRQPIALIGKVYCKVTQTLHRSR
jgi:hypothetical protein